MFMLNWVIRQNGQSDSTYDKILIRGKLRFEEKRQHAKFIVKFDGSQKL
tara:strand:- start:298 stop:444 length:147 start_codon:yes stop_codon:yes gene_type:complete